MSLENRIPPPVVALACAALIYLLRDQLRLQFGLQVLVGALILVVSLTVMLLAVREFHRARTTVNPLKPETATELVQSGVFSFSRNPMYLGLLGVLLAWTVFLGATTGLAVLVLFVTWMNLYQIRPEERAMQVLFEERYADYCNRVRRWL